MTLFMTHLKICSLELLLFFYQKHWRRPPPWATPWAVLLESCISQAFQGPLFISPTWKKRKQIKAHEPSCKLSPGWPSHLPSLSSIWKFINFVEIESPNAQNSWKGWNKPPIVPYRYGQWFNAADGLSYHTRRSRSSPLGPTFHQGKPFYQSNPFIVDSCCARVPLNLIARMTWFNRMVKITLMWVKSGLPLINHAEVIKTSITEDLPMVAFYTGTSIESFLRWKMLNINKSMDGPKSQPPSPYKRGRKQNPKGKSLDKSFSII